MTAFKIWHDTKHYIHKSTTNELDVTWTINPADAKRISNKVDAWKFFYDKLGFKMYTRYDRLYVL